MKVILRLVVLLPFAFAGVLSTHDPAEQHREHASVPPCREFLLGTDELGRDVLSRVLHGGRLSLLAGATAALLSVGVGLLLGGIAGYAGGWADTAVLRLADLTLALPWLYLLLAGRAALPLSIPGPLVLLMMTAIIGLAGSGLAIRMVRDVVRTARERNSVKAAAGLNARGPYLLRHHLWPAARPAAVTLWLTLVPQYVLAEVSLSFLGLGAGEPAVSWGAVLASLRSYAVLVSDWWMFSPAVALAFVVNVLGYRRKVAS